MEDTILLVAHGSRKQSSNQAVESFVKTWRQRQPNTRIEVCFLAFADITLEIGLDHAAQHAQRVIVVPLMLGAGTHVNVEIPQHIQQANQRHHDVHFVMTQHLGADPKVLQALQLELDKTLHDSNISHAQHTGVVVLAHGSSDKETNAEVAKIARWMFEENQCAMVDIAFTSITSPSLETVVQRQVACSMHHIIVLPYYLYTGILIERIGHQVEVLKQTYPSTSFGLGKCIGSATVMYDLLDERVAKAKEVN